MRINITVSLLLCGSATAAFAQQPSIGKQPESFTTPYYVAERGLHHRVWQRVSWFTNSVGIAIVNTNSYTELATGMAHYAGAELVDSRGEMVVTPTGAQATNAMHQLILAGNINTPGPNAIQVVLPDGQRMASKPLGLAYFDYGSGSGQSVWIGEITDSYGQLLPSKTQGVYPDALDGGGNCERIIKDCSNPDGEFS